MENRPLLVDIDATTRYFLINLTLIVVMGVIMVWSSSYMYAKEVFGSSTHFVLRQIIFVFVGVAVAFIVSKTKFNFWIKFSMLPHLFILLLLGLTLVPGVGMSIKGATRWLPLIGTKLQPGEFVKYSSIMLALYFFENFSEMGRNKRIYYAVLLLLPMVFLLLQPDFGAALICFLAIGFVCFMGSFPRKYFYAIIGVGLVAGLIFLFAESYRVQRIFSYLDPWKNPQTSGFQIIQSYLAFANGAFWGTGLGNSNEKLFYLPEAHNDFIFSVVGEEMGFAGVAIMTVAFICLIYLGFKLAFKTQSRFALIAVTAICFIVGIQAFLNMGVVLGLLPTKGLNLPFVSYGGSSLISNFWAIGLILSALRQSKKITYVENY